MLTVINMARAACFHLTPLFDMSAIRSTNANLQVVTGLSNLLKCYLSLQAL